MRPRGRPEVATEGFIYMEGHRQRQRFDGHPPPGPEAGRCRPCVVLTRAVAAVVLTTDAQATVGAARSSTQSGVRVDGHGAVQMATADPHCASSAPARNRVA
jgi:hypothetical protein